MVIYSANFIEAYRVPEAIRYLLSARMPQFASYYKSKLHDT